MQNVHKGDWMQTYTGRKIYPLSISVADVDIEDIAHALSMQCRYAGHCIKFYSVAEHCCLIADYLAGIGENRFVQLAGLMHDASEAYLVDVPRPVKSALADYREIEACVQGVVCERFGLPLDLPAIVKECDDRILNNERDQNTRSSHHQWTGVKESLLGVELRMWRPQEAKTQFVRRFLRLC